MRQRKNLSVRVVRFFGLQIISNVRGRLCGIVNYDKSSPPAFFNE